MNAAFNEGDMVMRRLQIIPTLSVVLLALGCFGWIVGASAQQDAEKQKTAKEVGQAIEKRMEESIQKPFLRGDVWQKMTPDEKVSFIWGLGHVIQIEKELMVRFPELKVDNFSKKAAEGMTDVSINDIVSRVDSYYQANPDKLDAPVVKVIWEELVKPNLKTGIAGRPIK